MLLLTLYKIYISANIWASPSNLLVIVVIAYCITVDGELEYFVLSIKEIIRSHDWENLATIIYKVLKKWDIISKLSYFQMDNVSNNNTILKALL